MKNSPRLLGRPCRAMSPLSSWGGHLRSIGVQYSRGALWGWQCWASMGVASKGPSSFPCTRTEPAVLHHPGVPQASISSGFSKKHGNKLQNSVSVRNLRSHLSEALYQQVSCSCSTFVGFYVVSSYLTHCIYISNAYLVIPVASGKNEGADTLYSHYFGGLVVLNNCIIFNKGSWLGR